MRFSNYIIKLTRSRVIKGWIGSIGNLDFSFQNTLKEEAKNKMQIIQKILKEVEAWQVEK
jgi:hypothetical protein